MTDTQRSPSSTDADAYGWTNTTNAKANGGGYAYSPPTVGNKLLAFNYGFAIPATDVIYGITVRTDQWRSAGGLSLVIGLRLSWDGGTSWTPQKTYNGNVTVETTFNTGGSAELWGRTWTLAEINSSNFMVEISITAAKTPYGGDEVRLDWIPITVTHGLPPPLPPQRTLTGVGL